MLHNNSVPAFHDERRLGCARRPTTTLRGLPSSPGTSQQAPGSCCSLRLYCTGPLCPRRTPERGGDGPLSRGGQCLPGSPVVATGFVATAPWNDEDSEKGKPFGGRLDSIVVQLRTPGKARSSEFVAEYDPSKSADSPRSLTCSNLCAEDWKRRQGCGVPEDIRFQTKSEDWLGTIRTALDRGPHKPPAAAHGNLGKFPWVSLNWFGVRIGA